VRSQNLTYENYDRQMALVAEYTNPQTGQTQIIDRLSKLHDTEEAEFSMLIAIILDL